MSDVRETGAQSEQALDHRLLLLAAPEVEVESLWLNGWLRHPLETQVDHRAVRHRQPSLEPLGLVGQRLGAERGFPEPAECLWVGGVDDDVLQVHDLSVGARDIRAPSVSEGTTFGGRRSHVTIEVIWSHKWIVLRTRILGSDAFGHRSGYRDVQTCREWDVS